jgi:hypothetical protein
LCDCARFRTRDFVATNVRMEPEKDRILEAQLTRSMVCSCVQDDGPLSTTASLALDRVRGNSNLRKNTEQKNTEQKKTGDEETVPDQELWAAIRYLDPDTETKASNIAPMVTSIVIFSICLACIIVLRLRGL